MDDRLKHILSSRQFTLGFLINLYKDTVLIVELLKTREGRELLTHVLRGYVIGEIFWQESSRTYHSSASAAARLGAQIIPERGVKKIKIKNGKKVARWELIMSSAVKDAWLEDEVKAWASFYDLLILRTPDDIEINYLKNVLADGGYDIPLINAGDGTREHPTQTLNDWFSIMYGLGLDPECDWSSLSTKSIVFLNDCKSGRTIHSLAWLLGVRFKMALGFVAPNGLEIPDSLREELKREGCSFSEGRELMPADVFYDTRNQLEYGGRKRKGISVDKQIADKYGVKIVLHPFPRSKKGNELPIHLIDKPETWNDSLDKDPRAMYFYQMKIGMPIKMALLKYLLNPYLDLKRLKEEKLIRGIKNQCAGCNRKEYHELGWTDSPPKCGYIQTLSHIFCPECQPR